VKCWDDIAFSKQGETAGLKVPWPEGDREGYKRGSCNLRYISYLERTTTLDWEGKIYGGVKEAP